MLWNLTRKLCSISTISFSEAVAIASQHLINLQNEASVELKLVKTQEEPFGWVFFYESEKYVETGNLSSMLAGNSPFLVDRKSRKIHTFGTAHPVDFYIKEYGLQCR